MLTAHIAAMVAAFFAVALGAGGQAQQCSRLPYSHTVSNLCGCTTNYSTGARLIIYFGLGYVSPQRVGSLTVFLVSLYHLAIWFGAGLVWWKILGWWLEGADWKNGRLEDWKEGEDWKDGGKFFAPSFYSFT